ncbi:hypothetical protein ACWIGW_21315 [Nocardia brasiliensis]
MDIIDVIVTFAKAGQVGALRLGLRGDELMVALRVDTERKTALGRLITR